MKNKILPSLFLALALSASRTCKAASTEPVTGTSSSTAIQLSLSYPREGAKISPVKNSFVLGSVNPPEAELTINGSSVSVYKTGSFAAYIPFDAGDFQIKAVARLNGLSAEFVRTVNVAPLVEPLPRKPLGIAQDSLDPSQDVKLPPGQRVPLRFRGSGGHQGEFRMKKGRSGEGAWIPMTERVSGSPGIYEGTLVMPPETGREFTVEYRLTGEGHQSVRAAPAGKFKVVNPNQYVTVEVSTAETVLRSGPTLNGDSMGYDLFLPRGVRLRAQGSIGNEERLELSPQEV